MPHKDATPVQTAWLSLRLVSGLSQREVERRLGWQKRGHLSLIERGVTPDPLEAHQLRTFYSLLLTNADAALSQE